MYFKRLYSLFLGFLVCISNFLQTKAVRIEAGENNSTKYIFEREDFPKLLEVYEEEIKFLNSPHTMSSFFAYCAWIYLPIVGALSSFALAKITNSLRIADKVTTTTEIMLDVCLIPLLMYFSCKDCKKNYECNDVAEHEFLDIVQPLELLLSSNRTRRDDIAQIIIIEHQNGHVQLVMKQLDGNTRLAIPTKSLQIRKAWKRLI